MSAFKEQQSTPDQGSVDAMPSITSTATTTPAEAEWRAAAVKRYKGHLRDSMQCGLAAVLKRVDHRSRNLALGHQARPSKRTKGLLSTLPRLKIGAQQAAPAQPECYFSLGGGWERWVPPAQLPPSLEPTPEAQNCKTCKLHNEQLEYLNWYEEMAQEAGRAGMSTADYIAITQANQERMRREEAANRAASEARFQNYYQSLLRERTMLLSEHAHMLQTEPAIVVHPAYQKWRLENSRCRMAGARAERKQREAWAMQFPDTRRLVEAENAGSQQVWRSQRATVLASMACVDNFVCSAFPSS